VVKLVDTLDLGSSAVRHGGSSPSWRTIIFCSAFIRVTHFFVSRLHAASEPFV